MARWPPYFIFFLNIYITYIIYILYYYIYKSGYLGKRGLNSSNCKALSHFKKWAKSGQNGQFLTIFFEFLTKPIFRLFSKSQKNPIFSQKSGQNGQFLIFYAQFLTIIKRGIFTQNRTQNSDFLLLNSYLTVPKYYNYPGSFHYPLEVEIVTLFRPYHTFYPHNPQEFHKLHDT